MSITFVHLPFLAVCIAALGVSGCSSYSSPTSTTSHENAYPTLAAPEEPTAPEVYEPAEASLYERLGGMSAIEAVVDQAVTNFGSDPRINMFFLVDLENLRTKLSEQVCDLAGGPCSYTGLDMREAHKNMVLTDEHFDALVEGLVAALNQFNVPEREQGELLAPLAAMREDVLNR